MTNQRAKLTKSKATASTTALQTLEITTTAIVTDRDSPKEDDDHKQLHHRHYHYVRSPAFEISQSPLPSPQLLGPSELPPVLKNTSEAVVALQDAVKESNKLKKQVPTSELEILQSSFFSHILLIQWSNVIGPKVEKVWPEEGMDENTQMMIARQVLNGELSATSVESKWIWFSSMICTAFLFEDSTVNTLCAICLVVPKRYQKNFAQYLPLLQNRVPDQLVKPLVQLRKIHKREKVSWNNTLECFTINWLMPFVKSIMDLESVSLPIDCAKLSHTMLNDESKQMLNSPFIAKIITSHLQTFGSTVLTGNNLSSVNMMINTLSLFLSSKEKSRSCHARKSHRYIPGLYLQGLLIKDVEDMCPRIELAVLDSIVPTTLVDMTRIVVKKTPLYHHFQRLRASYQNALFSKLEDGFACRYNNRLQMSDWSKRSYVFEKVNNIAPMVQVLLEEVRAIPENMRDVYIKQWNRSLTNKALAMIKFVEDGNFFQSKSEERGLIIKLSMKALSIYDMDDFIIILTQAEKLKHGIADLFI
ncbi:C9orf72-like protein family-domain-containing protein [Sporodiniella umbellata]|nr:C9orf72-like protein family-domain-containing protein [Sporodiniella umbellata]